MIMNDFPLHIYAFHIMPFLENEYFTKKMPFCIADIRETNVSKNSIRHRESFPIGENNKRNSRTFFFARYRNFRVMKKETFSRKTNGFCENEKSDGTRERESERERQRE